jgi:hypothetical protein
MKLKNISKYKIPTKHHLRADLSIATERQRDGGEYRPSKHEQHGKNLNHTLSWVTKITARMPKRNRMVRKYRSRNVFYFIQPIFYYITLYYIVLYYICILRRDSLYVPYALIFRFQL